METRNNNKWCSRKNSFIYCAIIALLISCTSAADKKEISEPKPCVPEGRRP